MQPLVEKDGGPWECAGMGPRTRPVWLEASFKGMSKLSCRFASLSQTMVRARSIGLNHPELMWNYTVGGSTPGSRQSEAVCGALTELVKNERGHSMFLAQANVMFIHAASHATRVDTRQQTEWSRVWSTDRTRQKRTWS